MSPSPGFFEFRFEFRNLAPVKRREQDIGKGAAKSSAIQISPRAKPRGRFAFGSSATRRATGTTGTRDGDFLSRGDSLQKAGEMGLGSWMFTSMQPTLG